MAITFRAGKESDFDPNKQRGAEPAITIDTGKMFITFSAGNTKQVATWEDFEKEITTLNESSKQILEDTKEAIAIAAGLAEDAETAVSKSEEIMKKAEQMLKESETALNDAKKAMEAAEIGSDEAIKAAESAIKLAQAGSAAAIEEAKKAVTSADEAIKKAEEGAAAAIKKTDELSQKVIAETDAATKAANESLQSAKKQSEEIATVVSEGREATEDTKAATEEARRKIYQLSNIEKIGCITPQQSAVAIVRVSGRTPQARVRDPGIAYAGGKPQDRALIS